MYGLVNKAIKDLITEKFGIEKWQEICQMSNFPDEDFIGLKSYPDKLTYDLVMNGSRVLGADASVLLEAFGEYWILYTAEEGYGNMLQLAGNTLPEFLANLDMLHLRVSNIMPHLVAPQFSVRNEKENSVELEYRSSREGLLPMVIGLLRGLGKRFGKEVQSKVIEEKNEQNGCYVIEVSW